MTKTVGVKRLIQEARLPHRANETDAGLDVYAAEDKWIEAGSYETIRTGIAIELPPSTEAQIRPRSGLAHKFGITVLNSPGTIDEGYRGEIKIMLINHGKEAFQVEVGMRIAQMVIAPVLLSPIKEIQELTETPRGEGGFGSSGLRDDV
ncbi:dUTP diphosphatase [Paenalkalicoccus suaedae]|uniref:Deoxyuridine 5'-triphosphate nucleotidohydrolase n=1 Tax=Paenalkalicoccus suaedae TaxID=2592382 RepID=A0A859FFX3_9BACI|nr:dUTP diphosphatase [Paenalkalicoccus suaedae]QKS72007.1 dUTP diphosphatase [Paenalkalicoccus suaedae]